jgi:uncharacterized protein YigA (DUF484 family)
MTGSQEPVRIEEEDLLPSPDQVEAYLRANPAFLIDRPELIAVLAPPSRYDAGSVVDLQTVMLNRLRDESRDLRDAANLLISTTRSNMIIQTRTHAAVMALLGADNFDRLIHVVRFDLPLLLDVDTVSLCFETASANPPELADVRWVPTGSVARALGGNEHPAVRMLEDVDDDGQVFGEAAGLVKSAAIARVMPGSGISAALLALGARERGAFHSGQASDLLTFLAKVTEMCLHRWLPTALA